MLRCGTSRLRQPRPRGKPGRDIPSPRAPPPSAAAPAPAPSRRASTASSGGNPSPVRRGAGVRCRASTSEPPTSPLPSRASCGRRPSPHPALSLISGLPEISPQGVEVGNSRLRGGRGAPRALLSRDRAGTATRTPPPGGEGFARLVLFRMSPNLEASSFSGWETVAQPGGGDRPSRKRRAMATQKARPSWSPSWRPSTSSRVAGGVQDVDARDKPEHDSKAHAPRRYPSPGGETRARRAG